MFKMVMIGFFMTILSGCSFVDRHASAMAEQVTEPNKCTTETTQTSPDYTTTSSYRCVGDGCQHYGCRKP